MPPSPITRLRKLCLALPDATEVEAWGEPTFRIRNRMFATFASAESHHGAGRPAAWIKAAPENQSLMVKGAPTRYFVPPYVGTVGWIGVWLDKTCDWKALAELLQDGYERAAARKPARRRKPASSR